MDGRDHGCSSKSPPALTLDSERPKTDAPVPLRAVHTPNFPALLRRIGASLLVTTYQAGKLVLVRDEGDNLNTHFRGFQAPMGMALAGDRLAVGTMIQVWEFVDVPAVTAKLDPPGRHDACFLPRSCHVTGNIQIHEMAWGAGGGSGSSTPGSLACARSTARPASRPSGGRRSLGRWSPPTAATSTAWGWSTAARATSTALGETDEPAGWRANKAKGGILMDVASGEVITRGLSMPHSPRWYAGRLWVCESGDGNRDAISIDSNRLLRLLGKLIASRFPYPGFRTPSRFPYLTQHRDRLLQRVYRFPAGWHGWSARQK